MVNRALTDVSIYDRESGYKKDKINYKCCWMSQKVLLCQKDKSKDIFEIN